MRTQKYKLGICRHLVNEVSRSRVLIWLHYDETEGEEDSNSV